METEQSVVVRIIFLESRNLQFLWDLIESDLANMEHLGRWFVVTVWTWRTGHAGFCVIRISSQNYQTKPKTGMNGSFGDWSMFCQVICIAVHGDHVIMGPLFN